MKVLWPKNKQEQQTFCGVLNIIILLTRQSICLCPLCLLWVSRTPCHVYAHKYTLPKRPWSQCAAVLSKMRNYEHWQSCVWHHLDRQSYDRVVTTVSWHDHRVWCDPICTNITNCECTIYCKRWTVLVSVNSGFACNCRCWLIKRRVQERLHSKTMKMGTWFIRMETSYSIDVRLLSSIIFNFRYATLYVI